MRRAIIVGHTGQDGRILWDQLTARHYSLLGISSREVLAHEAALPAPVAITDPASVLELLGSFQPDEIYYLAAHHHNSQDSIEDETALWQASLAVHVQGLRNVLDAMRRRAAKSRLFFASSSRVFGISDTARQDETTPRRPACIYGLTKAMGMELVAFHRRNHGLFAASGILYNHESPLRGAGFVSRRVVDGLVAIKAGHAHRLELGSLEARVDWGHAPDYTRAMQAILAAAEPADFVVASGRTHSIGEMVAIAAGLLDLDWRDCVAEKPGILQRASQELCGDATKLHEATGWAPETSFEEMIAILVNAGLARAGMA